MQLRSLVWGTVAGVGALGSLAGQETTVAAQALGLVRAASLAAEANDAAGRLARLEEAAKLRPDFPQFLPELAAAQLGAGQPDAAVATLDRLAGFGLYAAVEKAAEFAALRSRPDFQAVGRRLAANLHPVGRGETAFVLREVTGRIEGIAWREKTAEFFLADVQARCVWRRQQNGTLQRFSVADDAMLGVFALGVDEAAGALWAATAAVPAMSGFTPEQAGAAALVELDLQTGAVRRTLGLPRAPGDSRPRLPWGLGLGDDGGVWVLEQEDRKLWHLAPGSAEPTVAVESDEFLMPRGLAVLPGGALIVADLVNGLLRVDPARREVKPIQSPEGSTLVDIIGLALAPDGALLAVQTVMRPSRVLRLELDAGGAAVERIAVLESGHLAMSAPAAGAIGPGGGYYFVGNAGASRAEFLTGEPTAPRALPILVARPPAVKR